MSVVRPRQAVAIAAVAAMGLGLAARWDLLADEAYHWSWSLRPAFGYYDQPPLIAWVLAAERSLLGDSALALRAVPWITSVASCAILMLHAADRRLAGALLFGLPPLVFLTKRAIPDALLLACWAGALAAAISGRAWMLAGVLAGLAALAKYTGLLLFPLLWVAADRQERGRALRGLLLGAVLFAPNLWWNATHGWQTFGFQLGEGLLHPLAPGPLGPLRQIAEQILVVTPLVAAAAVWWAFRRPRDRVARFAWWTSIPILIAFALAAWGGPPEAHWPAPAWLGVAIGLSHAGGGLRMLARTGAALAAATSILLVVHVERPVVALRDDPAARFAEGTALGTALGRPSVPVLTERYQEASRLSWHGVQARVLPGCGRRVEGSDERFAPPERALFVRPSRSGPPACAAARYAVVRGPSVVRGADRAGRPVGPWDVFELER